MHDESKMMWEEYAEDAVVDALDRAEFDEIRQSIALPVDDDHRAGRECFSFDELERRLIDLYNEKWYAYVPFDGGNAVFTDDAEGYVGDLLASRPELEEFFQQHGTPANAEPLIRANELLVDQAASRIVRITSEEVNGELVRYLAAHPEEMRELSPRKFEVLVAEMYRDRGYDVTLTPKSKDGGVDVIAVQRSDVGTVMLLIECKRYAVENPVGVEIVRGLYGVVEERGATRGIVATTSYFTHGAREFRNSVTYRLGLADFDVLTSEVRAWKR